MSKLLSNRIALAVGGVVVAAVVAWLFAYEPVTRNLIFQDALCTYCHGTEEYQPTVQFAFRQPHKAATEGMQSGCVDCHLTEGFWPETKDATHPARLAFGQPHKATPQGGLAACVDCHLPKGFWPTTYAYTHLLSATDLFGRFRDRQGERAGDWMPMSAARAARVRERLFENDSVTCRSCHVESEIQPKRARGKRAHEMAKADKNTCIECHYNLVHREVELPKTAFKKAAAEGGDREGKK